MRPFGPSLGAAVSGSGPRTREFCLEEFQFGRIFYWNSQWRDHMLFHAALWAFFGGRRVRQRPPHKRFLLGRFQFGRIFYWNSQWRDHLLFHAAPRAFFGSCCVRQQLPHKGVCRYCERKLQGFYHSGTQENGPGDKAMIFGNQARAAPSALQAAIPSSSGSSWQVTLSQARSAPI